MVDDVKELDGAVKNPNDHHLSLRMKTLQRALLHTKTSTEIKQETTHKRIEADQKAMSDRLKTWHSSHRFKKTSKTRLRTNANRSPSPPSPPSPPSQRFVRTSAQVSAAARTTQAVGGGGGEKSQYVTTQEPPSAAAVPRGMTPDIKDALFKSIEAEVENSATLKNPEIIEHTGEADPDQEDPFKKQEEGGEKEEDSSTAKEEAPTDLDGPENGGEGEEPPIYKYYKWWNLANWDNKALESMVNSPTHGQLNSDVGGKRSETNTHGDDAFAANMAEATSGTLAIEGEGTGGEPEEDGATKCTDCTPFPAWTRKDNWIRTDGNFAQGGLVPPTETDQKELEDAKANLLPEKSALNDPLDPANGDALAAGADVGEGAVQNTLTFAMNAGVDASQR